MRLIQPKPDHSAPIKVAEGKREPCPVPVSFVRYRYAHHAAPSGYDRICDYLDAEEVRLPGSLYWAGETLMRPWALWVARTCGVFEHSRYDCIREQAVIRHARRSEPRIYHFVYGEKSFLRSGSVLSRHGHRSVLTMHHPEGSVREYFQGFAHLAAVHRILTMDHAMVAKWNEWVGRDLARWIPHGVDCDYFQPKRRPSSGLKTIVFAGTHARDINTLLRVVEQLAEDRDLRFHFLSKDPRVIALSDRFPAVRVDTWVDDAGYRRLLEEADLLLLPLEHSTVCNVVLEALACGVPVATSEGGIGAYLDPASSAMLPAGNIHDWCSAVTGLLERGDGARQQARQQALKFRWEEIARMHSAIYQEMITS